jgi:hypothetical protein
MSGQDALLATKLHVPRPQPGFVPRRRLLQALGEGWLGAGCWCALRRDSAKRRCWPTGPAVAGGRLGLDAGDSDPARF